MNIISEFEKEFKRFTGSRNAIACCNGTSALHTALLALGIGKGDKVITTPFSFIASSNCILYVGATPLFADIDPETYCLDPKEVLKQYLLNHKNVKAIICVHLFGRSCNMRELFPIASENRMSLIEDCCQAFGSKYDNPYNNLHVGNLGEFGCFSFHKSKNLWTFEGGMLITNNDDLAEKARMIINQGRSSRFVHKMLGYNYRMPEPCALIGMMMLKRHKQAVLSELGKFDVKDGYYPHLIYQQPFYVKMGIKAKCPNAERLAAQIRSKTQ